MNSLTWLVSDDNGAPFSLVRTKGRGAQVIAGSGKAIAGFKNGKPNLDIVEPWCFEPISGNISFPAIGQFLKKLGAYDPAAILRAEKRKERKRQEAVAKRERAKNLTPDQLAEIQEMISRDVKRSHIAEKFQISEACIRRLNPDPVVPYSPPHFGGLKGADLLACGGAKNQPSPPSEELKGVA